MIIKEIGSEFHYFPITKNKLSQNIIDFPESAIVFSGRTAIETILKNIPTVKKALLPSYCCQSMIEPFYNANICVEYYDVFYEDELRIDLNINYDIDLILWCNYFGFRFEMPNLSNFLNRGGIIIEDITHSFLSTPSYNFQSQYVVASIRKWFPLLSGGYCAAIGNQLKYKPHKVVPSEFLELKKMAMIQKSQYLKNNDIGLKNQFTKNFYLSNKWLSTYYSGLKVDSESIEILNNIKINEVKKIRRENALLIYDFLNKQKFATPLFKLENMDCPLFVPIIFKTKEERNLIREKLIESKIYCPVHWPKPDDKCFSNLYELELSLICDQRYDLGDIERMMKVLCDL